MELSIVISDYGEAKTPPILSLHCEWAKCEGVQLGPHSRDASGPGYARTVVMRVEVNKAM